MMPVILSDSCAAEFLMLAQRTEIAVIPRRLGLRHAGDRLSYISGAAKVTVETRGIKTFGGAS